MREEYFAGKDPNIDYSELLRSDFRYTKQGRYAGKETATYLVRCCLLKGFSRAETGLIMRACGRSVNPQSIHKEWRMLKNLVDDGILVIKSRERRLPSLQGRESLSPFKSLEELVRAKVVTEDFKLTQYTNFECSSVQSITKESALEILRNSLLNIK